MTYTILLLLTTFSSWIPILSQLGLYLEAYFYFCIFSIPSCLSRTWSSFDLCMPDLTFFWIFLMECFLKILWFSLCRQQHTKVSVLLVYTWLLLWCIFYCWVLKLVIDGVKRSSIVWRIQFIECSDDVLVQSILYIFQFSTFLTNFTLLTICLVCLVSLPILAIHIANLISNIIIRASSETLSGSLFKNSWINIMKCAKSIPVLHAELYSLPALD